MLLTIRYPEAYPDEAPMLDLSAPQNSLPHQYFTVADNRESLLRSLDTIIEENLGMAMIFTLVSSLKDAAEQLVAERKEAATKAHEEAILAAEREENKKFHGTPVTAETFLKWREGFLKEMEEARIKAEEERLAELKKTKIKEPVKLTGRQLWERGLAGKDDQEEDNEDDVPLGGMEKLSVGNTQ